MAQASAAHKLEEIWTEPWEWTYEDYLNLPDDGCRYEIIEGLLYMTNAPDIDHQFAVMEIAFQIKLFVNHHKLGYVLTAPFEVHLSETTRPVQPDVLFIRAEKWPGAGVKYFEGAPDIVIEVLSPASRRTDQVIKFTAYEKAKVPEYWIVNPKAGTVQVFCLEGEQYISSGEFSGKEMIRSLLLPDMEIIAESLFSK